jgi:hypothetical protein
MLWDWDNFLKDFNPLDQFWKLTYPLFNPKPGSSPVRISAPSPVWDLPSPYGNVQHPDNKDSIPHFVHPDYFQKLYTEPPFEVVSRDPPVWMIVENFNKRDLLFKFPVCLATAPVFFLAYHRIKKTPTNWYTWFSSAVLGSSLGYTVIFQDSENRLQGYLENAQDVEYWRQKAEYERKVLRGEIDPAVSQSLAMQGLQALFGAQKVDVTKLEDDYYGVKPDKK